MSHKEGFRIVLDDGTTYVKDACETWWILLGDEEGPHTWSHVTGALVPALDRIRDLAIGS